MNNRVLAAFVALPAILMATVSTLAQPLVVLLETTTLPSAQVGWTYEAVLNGAGFSESDVFSPNFDFMTIDTMGQPFGLEQGANRAVHELNPATDFTGSTLVATMDTRVLDHETALFHNPFGVTLVLSGRAASIGLTRSQLQFSDLSGVSFGPGPSQLNIDPGEWHTYQLVSRIGETTYRVYVDGQLVATPDAASTNEASRIRFGDNTGSANARADFRNVEFRVTAGCNEADLAPPFGTLDFSDVVAFLTAFGTMDPAADLAPPMGVFDFSDVVAFLGAFGAGCP